jgi:4-amino-4-deoxy-L-arabinose transferase-like glycosyltransferase
MTPDSNSGSTTAQVLPRPFATPSGVFCFIGLYFGWQIVVRLMTSNSAELDEAEQLFLTQQLAWGYGPQPPLYTWLQFPFIAVFGPSILALALLKNLLLFGTYAFVFLTARLLTRSQLAAVAATMSLLFVPQISWESQRDLTHSVLVTLLAAATLYVFLRLAEERKPGLYAAFGLCIGLGLLAKYSFLLFLTGLLVAALSLRSLRPVVCSRGMALALVLAAAMVAPHAVWAVQHQDAVFSAAGKFHFAASRPWLETLAVGLKNLVGSVVVHIGALLGIYFLVCRKRLAHPAVAAVKPDYVRLIARSLGIIFALLVLAIVFLRMTSFKDRWLLPIFICVPACIAAILQPRLNVIRVRILIVLAVVVMAAVSILLPERIRLAERLNKPDQQNAPIDWLTEQIRPSLKPGAVVAADSVWLAGNLRMFFPDHVLVAPRSTLSLPARERECLLVWDATRSEPPPEVFTNVVAELAGSGSNQNERRYVEAPLKFFQTQRMRLGLMRSRLKD